MTGLRQRPKEVALHQLKAPSVKARRAEMRFQQVELS
jgi:hypothetical protein